MDKIWHNLYDYESKDLIERYIEKNYNRKASKRQIIEISSNFIQGREFFRNSEKSNFSVKPLLLYYGVNSISRGLILLLNPHLSESSLKPSHGLETINWRDYISNNDIINLPVEIKKGAFYELITETKNKSYLKLNSSGVNWNAIFPIPNLNSRFTLSDLIQTFPDLSIEYNKWTSENLHPIKINSFDNENNVYKFNINKYNLNTAKIQSTLGNKFEIIKISEFQNHFELIISQDNIPQFTQSINQDPFEIGEVVISKIINENIYLNSLSQFYSLSFFLGMLSRYFPSYWINLNKTEKGDCIYPLFLKSLDIISKEYPKLIAEYLDNPRKK